VFGAIADRAGIDAKAGATEAEKALAAKATAEKEALAAKAGAERQQAEDSLAREIDSEIKRNWEDEVSGSRSWVDPIIAARMRHWVPSYLGRRLRPWLSGEGRSGARALLSGLLRRLRERRIPLRRYAARRLRGTGILFLKLAGLPGNT
jgi:hypothetical protein